MATFVFGAVHVPNITFQMFHVMDFYQIFEKTSIIEKKAPNVVIFQKH